MSDKATSIEVKATVNGEKVYVSSMQAVIAIGATSWPRVTLTVYPPGEESTARKLTQDSVVATMAKWQTKMFSARNGPEVEIEVKIKNGESSAPKGFKFKGLITGPAFDFSTKNVALQIECVPEYAQIDSLSYSIYKEGGKALQISGDPNLAEAETICNLINQTQQKLREKFDPDENSESADVQYAKAQHQINEKVVKYFEELLTASNKEEVFGWTDIIEGLIWYGDDNLRSTINSCLLQSAGPFSGTLDRIAETFGCVCVHNWETIGVFLNKYNLMKNEKTLTTDTISMSISATSGFGLLPPGFVGVISPYYNPSDLPMEPENNFVVYPKENAEQGIGVMQQTMGPSWVNDSIVTQEVTSSARTKGLDVEEVEGKVEEDREKKKESIESALNILELWGKSAYINLALQNSTVTMQVPLNFKPVVGTYYNVKTAKGTSLFRGLLACASHVISAEGGSPQAITTLNFTHVQLNGFTLPHAN